MMGSGFNPLTMAPAVWYDPSDLSTMWQDSARTTPASIDGVVGAIDDKSGNARHATQATTASKPILRKVGSLFRLQFDGVDDFMTANFGATIPQTMTAILAATMDVGTLPFSRVFDGLNGVDRVLMGYQDNLNFLAFAGTTNMFVAQAIPMAATVWSARFAGAASHLRRNAVQVSAANAGANSLSGLTLGNSFGATEPLMGTLSQLIIVPAAVADYTGVEQFVATKAGVVL